VVRVKSFWREVNGRINGGTRVLEVSADSRKVVLGKGARSTSTIAHEVEHTHPRGWSSAPTTRRTSAAKGAARFSGADIRLVAAGKLMYGGFRLKLPYPASLRSEPRYDFPTQPLPSSVLSIDRSASCGVLRLSRKDTAHVGALLLAQATRGGYGRYCSDQAQPETIGTWQVTGTR
jgi:hypothetical protein